MPRNKAVVQSSREALNRLKEEVASDFGIVLGGQTEARFNGSVGGEMVKRLIAHTQETLAQLPATRR